MMGKPTREEVFIYVDVRYSGADVLQLSPQNFRLADASGVEHSPQSYDGADPLKPEDLLGAAHVAGWLLFTMPKGARNLSLVYQQSEQTQSGITLVTLLARTSPFTPRPSLTRLYAANAQRALDAYLLDEALAAGYIRMEVNPLYMDGGGSLYSTINLTDIIFQPLAARQVLSSRRCDIQTAKNDSLLATIRSTNSRASPIVSLLAATGPSRKLVTSVPKVTMLKRSPA